MMSPKHGVSIATINLTGVGGTVTEQSGSNKALQSCKQSKNNKNNINNSELLEQLSPSLYPSNLRKLDGDGSSNQQVMASPSISSSLNHHHCGSRHQHFAT